MPATPRVHAPDPFQPVTDAAAQIRRQRAELKARHARLLLLRDAARGGDADALAELRVMGLLPPADVTPPE